MLAKLLLPVLALGFCTLAAAQSAQRFDVVITEIMADPTPAVGLPNAEFVELQNVSATPLNLSGWRLADANGSATITASYVLQPDSVVILCANSNVAQLSPFGRTIGLASFPSLDNDGEWLLLRSPQGRIMHAVQYSVEWYGNDVKREGGWSLEMIDPKNPCGGKENWKASSHQFGGTPGKTNAVDAVNADGTPPQLQRTYSTDSVTVIAVFDEPLDSASAASAAAYSLQGLTVLSAVPQPPLFQSVQLRLNSPLQPQTLYLLSVNNLSDCKGNNIGAFNKAPVGWAQPAGKEDLIINEILFNPKPGTEDYLELYNRSKKIIDAATLYIANRSGSGAAANLRRLAEAPFYLFPGDYLVLTENKASLLKSYFVKNEAAVLSLSSLPSYPDDEGTAVLLNNSGDVLDELAYDKDWHFALLSDPEGVALERTGPDAPTQQKDSWQSAASTAGWGTPTYLNSQHQQADAVKATVAVSPPVFSPDNDGRDDRATVQYQLSEAGYVANVSVFDAGGRLVRHLVKNETLTLRGSWHWDGLGERQQKLPVGTYIVYTEFFNLQGKRKRFKHTIVVARPLN